jgi:N-acetylmuramoyl-L-alanine amidase
VSRIHRVEQGESIASIADAYGFFEGTLWNHPDNAALRARRKRPTVLAPGDEVYVPDLQLKEVSKATGARYTFRRRGIPAIYRVRVLDHGKPVANASYVLTIDGTPPSRGTTDAQGRIEARVPPDARTGELRIPAFRLRAHVRFGHLDPVDEVSGIQKRLINLGYLRGEPSGVEDAATQAALRTFQEAHSLAATGVCDEKTRAALESTHDVSR